MSKDRRSSRRSYSAADREAAAQARREKVTALHEQITAGVQELTCSQAWTDMLAAAARFRTYSFRNVIAIQAQCPGARRVAGFHAWKAMGRSVRKGEKGIQILAPCTYRVRNEEPDQAVPVGGGAGEPEPEAGQHEPGARRLRGFTVAYVFAECQTEGEPVPEVCPQLLAGQAPVGLFNSLTQHVAQLGYALRREECGSANGYADGTQRVIVVRPDIDEAQATKTLVHEVAHVLLGHTAEGYPYAAQRETAEVAAESVAAIVCTTAGMDTTSYSIPYLSRWADGDTELIMRTGTAVVAAATELIARHLPEEMCADRSNTVAS